MPGAQLHEHRLPRLPPAPALRRQRGALTQKADIFARGYVRRSEIFLDSNNDEFTYKQLCFNANGARFDSDCAGAYNYGESIFGVSYDKKKLRNEKWNGSWKVATSRQADRWEAEVIIPFKDVGRKSDLWGWLIGRNRRAGSGETSSSKAIGFFAQPALFGKLLLAGARTGSGQLTAWRMEPTWTGPSSLRLEASGLDGASGQAEVTGRDGEPVRKGEKGMWRNGALEIPYVLRTGDQDLAMSVAGADGRELFRFHQPIRVPDPLQILSGRPIFFPNDPAGEFHLATPVSNSIRANCRLEGSIEKEKKALAQTDGPLGGDRPSFSVDFRACDEGFYQIRFRLWEKGNAKPLAEKSLPLAVVPHFLGEGHAGSQ